jgi:3alpha(or 20beta)-hydroxysteroid dehydrogenase
MNTEVPMNGVMGVVTGAGGDIGLAVCQNLGERKATVLCVDIDEPRATRGAEAVRKAGGVAEAFVADVTNPEQVSAYADKARQLWGEARFFFNNAGIEGHEGPLANYPLDEWERVIATNLRGVFLGLKAMFPLLRHSDLARIVNTASVAGMIATPQLSAYGASKHAVIGLTKTAAVEFAPQTIAVNALCPGPVVSGMMERIEEGIAPGAAGAARKGYEQTIPQHRYATLDEVANLATYLLLDAPIYLTGQAIALDGGLSAV